MCRFIAYIGNPLTLDEVLFKPKNSLIKQSVHSHDRKEPLNGDGFGLGWYAQEIDSYPALFRSVQPAWNDLNLEYLTPKLRSNCFLAHVRSASQGNVSQNNCHPFHYKQFLFMHNGDIGDFTKIKRYIRRALSDDIYDWLRGETDSEHFFALFLNHFNAKELDFNANNVAKIMRQTIKQVEKIKKLHHGTEETYINAVITNGKSMVAVRYVSHPKKNQGNTLYYAAGSYYEFHDGTCHIRPAKNDENGAILIVSEPLTSYQAEWEAVPMNHLLLVFDDLSTSVQPI